MKKFICEVRNCGECNYVIDFMDDESGEVLEYLEENCLENCLIDLYEFERKCYEKYVISNSDVVVVRINDVMFGL